MRNDIASLRVDYGGGGFDESEAGHDPMQLFHAWFADAQRSDAVVEPNAMALATSTADGAPSVRMVLLKLVDDDRAGFTWFTNLDSRKAHEVFAREPGRAALVWWWPGDERVPGRQVRATGQVELLDRRAAAQYFASRPHDAQVAAAASQQSRPIASRAALEQRVQAVEERSGRDGTVPLPDDWGGITLLADELEFWQGRSGRLHDRIVFTRQGADWQRVRLQP